MKIVTNRLISAISVSKIRAARTTENMSSTIQHELNNYEYGSGFSYTN
jgi:hypothetical protein